MFIGTKKGVAALLQSPSSFTNDIWSASQSLLSSIPFWVSRPHVNFFSGH